MAENLHISQRTSIYEQFRRHGLVAFQSCGPKTVLTADLAAILAAVLTADSTPTERRQERGYNGGRRRQEQR